jgi:signal transduction histidine kinase
VTSRASAGREWWGNILLVAALVLPLILVIVILGHARRSERAQRDVAERALTHYAAVAAWQLANRIGNEYHARIETLTQPLLGSGGHRHTAGGAGDSTGCDCADSTPVRVAFRYMHLTQTLEVLAGEADSVTRLRLVRTAREAAEAPETEPHRLVFDLAGTTPSAVSLLIHREPGRTEVFGSESGVLGYARIVERILATYPLLPPGLLAPPYTSATLAVRVASVDGGLVYDNGGAFSSSSPLGSDSVPRVANLRVDVAIAPPVAETLVIGGLPRARTPALIGLLVLASALAGAAFLQHRRARELSHTRNEFIASVSHELRTPLTQISMFGETLMLGRERSEDERRRFASIIHRESIRLASLVENVMRFTRGSANGFTLRSEVRRLADEIDHAVAAFRPLADSVSARIVTDLDRDLHASVDPGAMRQIILNLLDNAVKYGPAGQRIELTLGRDGPHALLAVADEGPGIPEADRERIFEPFVRLDAAPRRVAGTGIGLAVVRELAAALGGSITVANRGTGGTIFTVRIPVAEPPTSGSGSRNAAGGAVHA